MGFGDLIGHLFDDLTGETGREEQRKMMNEQMKAYKEQTELTRQELASKRDETQAQKRRVEEKQIRGLRRNYSPSGFLGGQQQSSEPDMSTKLGG